jgi:hypothetical protein
VEGSDAVSTTPTPSPVSPEGRADLGFAAAVRKHFGWLPELGLHETSASAYHVDFESDAVRLRLLHDRLSYEISASFARRSHPGELRDSYSYGALLAVVDPSAAADYRDVAATMPDTVRTGVARLAGRLRRDGTPALAGEAAVYDELAHAALLAGEAMAAHSRRRAYGERAETAWQSKDWPEVVAAYSPYVADLTPPERRRLELARRRAEGSSD